MSLGIATVFWFIIIGMIIGWIYGLVAKRRGLPPATGMSISTLGSVGGGIIFGILNLGAILVWSAMTSVLVLFMSHVMSKA